MTGWTDDDLALAPHRRCATGMVRDLLIVVALLVASAIVLKALCAWGIACP